MSRARKEFSVAVQKAKRAPRGALLEWLTAHVDHDGGGCLTWPFGRDSSGRGELRLDGKMRNAAREMCRLAHGEPPSSKHEAAHTCGQGHEACVNPAHLVWKTRRENEADKLTHGTINRGERNGGAVLTAPQVLVVRQRLSNGDAVKVIASDFGVSDTAIRAIGKGRKWGWLHGAA